MSDLSPLGDWTPPGGWPAAGPAEGLGSSAEPEGLGYLFAPLPYRIAVHRRAADGTLLASVDVDLLAFLYGRADREPWLARREPMRLRATLDQLLLALAWKANRRAKDRLRKRLRRLQRAGEIDWAPHQGRAVWEVRLFPRGPSGKASEVVEAPEPRNSEEEPLPSTPPPERDPPRHELRNESSRPSGSPATSVPKLPSDFPKFDGASKPPAEPDRGSQSYPDFPKSSDLRERNEEKRTLLGQGPYAGSSDFQPEDDREKNWRARALDEADDPDPDELQEELEYLRRKRDLPPLKDAS